MLQSKLLSVFGALAIVALAAGAGSSKAGIIFGSFAPPPGSRQLRSRLKFVGQLRGQQSANLHGRN
jgi:hypothetical protein